MFEVGTLLANKYRIVGEVGRGGMGVVYRAHDEQHSRDVAVKVLTGGILGAEGVSRFEREILTTANLGHPHILDVLDSGDHEGALYYVTRFVEGESLRERLDREGALDLAEVLRIGSAMAAALAHAHQRGVVHRDVKPSNILLDEDGNPYLADFGIARALMREEGEHRTSTGASIGTPEYMSPEQIEGETELDGRTDVYALGCVLFEMLAGERPFVTRSRAAAYAAHLARPIPSISDVRPEVPAEVEALLKAAMAKERDSRIGAASELRSRLDDCLAGTRSSRVEPSRIDPQRTRWIAALTVLGLVTAVVIGIAGRSPSGAPSLELDSMRIAVLLPGVLPPDGWTAPVTAMMGDALSRWSDLEVVGQFDEGPGSGSAGIGPTGDDALEEAQQLEAGRYVQARTTRVGDSIRVEMVMREAAGEGRRLSNALFLLPAESSLGQRQVDRMVESMLFGQNGLIEEDAYPWRGRSAAAQQAFVLGREARDHWDLLGAGSHFAQALQHDAEFGSARLWLAQLRNWENRPAAEWAVDAQRAVASADDLPPRERRLAAALVAMSEDRHPDACQAYEDLLGGDPDDFAARFGLGACHARDPIVVADAASPTGWAFRSSSHVGASEFQRALMGLPARHFGFGAGGFELAQSMLFVRGSLLRRGRRPGVEGDLIVGFPEWHGDSLAIIAVPGTEAGNFNWDQDAARAAVVNQRRAMLSVAEGWVRAFPESADALYTLGVARELLGDPTALAAYSRAREMSTDPALTALIGADEVPLRVRIALPGDTAALAEAVELGVASLNTEGPLPVSVSARLAPLALLLGRPSQAARLARAGSRPGEDLALRQESQALVAFATLGVPLDSIVTIERRLETRITQSIPADRIASTRVEMLRYAAILAYPTDAMLYFRAPGSATSALGRAVERAGAGDPTGASESLGPLGDENPWDVVVTHAEIHMAGGRPEQALSLLSGRLDRLGTEDPDRSRSLANAGSVGRAALLRARLEAHSGLEEAADRWTSAIRVLWRDAEPVTRTLLAIS